ncbi:hypothetical protein SOV_52440 [Sporomusa ovata DSM 2662]|uniref:Phage protein n=1 Tax=Sporomusa ovata TaxID=2378 RepID=A0A0U1KRC2_9FIRM|nr:DUF932 domain-containing protein [Sporomusa ovata]EQB27616.1 hypothetical protein SOV_2c05130 [Sporomusa ovata DSM 2662]CQR69968.1 Phage protein [Sporomusa ovata]
MKQGKSIIQLAQELERQRQARKDFIADTRSLQVQTDVSRSQLRIKLDQAEENFWLNELAHKQLAERLQIPQKYYNKMRFEYPALLDENINSWLEKQAERRMIRTLDGQVRAFLSDRYRRLDNLELADAIFPILQDLKTIEVVSSEVTETHMYIKITNKRLRAEVAVGDVVQAGLVISNSEVGLGSLKVEPLIFRLVCKNGLIVKDYAQKRYHVGKQIENEDSAYEIFSDETLAQDDKAFFMKVQDTVRVAIDEVKFHLSVDKLKAAMQESTGRDPVKTVEVLADRYILNQNERGSILRHFIMGGDNSWYGLINAVTRASQDVEDYSRATDLERLGGELLALPLDKGKVPVSVTPVIKKNRSNIIPLEMVK